MERKTTAHCWIFVFVCIVCGCNSVQRNSNILNTQTPQPVSRISSETDHVGDVDNGNKRKLREKLPGIDLTNARIESFDLGYKLTLTASSDFPITMPTDEAAVWQATLCAPNGDRCCLVGAKIVEREWMAYIFEMTPGRNIYIDKPVVAGNVLVVSVPSDKLPDWARNPFNWWVVSERQEGWKDRIPDAGKDFLNAPTISFPKSQAAK